MLKFKRFNNTCYFIKFVEITDINNVDGADIDCLSKEDEQAKPEVSTTNQEHSSLAHFTPVKWKQVSPL